MLTANAMRAITRRVALLVTILALAPTLARGGRCDLAMQYANAVMEGGKRAAASNSMVEAANLANDARYPAIDAAQHAKACGCTEAIPLLAEAAQSATRANAAFNLTGARQYGAAISKDAQAALEALRRCNER